MSHGSDSKRETAEYIATLAGELAQIAGQQKLDVLRYLLEMAWQEARSIAHDQGTDNADE